MIEQYLLNEQRDGGAVTRMYANNDRAVSVRIVGEEAFLTAYRRTGPGIYNVVPDEWGGSMSVEEAEIETKLYLEDDVPDQVRES